MQIVMPKNKFNYSQLSTKKCNPYKVDVENDPCVKFYLENAKKYNKLSTEEEQDLIARIKSNSPDSDRLRDKLIGSHQPFIIMFAQKYCPIGSDLFMDLIQEGNYGMCMALDRFDHTKNVKFLSYANAWVVKYMFEFLQNNELVKRSNRSKTWCIDVKVKEEFIRKYGYEPTCEELLLIFNEMGIILKRPEDLQEIQVVSMDQPAPGCWSDNEDDEPTGVEYGEIDDIVGRFDKSEKAARINKIMADELTEYEKTVISLKFGFDNQDEYTNKDIAAILGTTPYKIKLVINGVIEKLKPYGSLFE